jgi:hypothetical protein
VRWVAGEKLAAPELPFGLRFIAFIKIDDDLGPVYETRERTG